MSIDSILNFLYNRVGMKGYVTWLACTGLVSIAVLKAYKGDYEIALGIISIAGGFVGLGRKDQKTKELISDVKETVDGISEQNCQ